MPDPDQDAPYKPTYKGFDEDRQKKAVETVERANEGAGAKGEDANREYVDDGPQEAAERTGRSTQDVGDAVERAARKKR
jgi:hypothetical protein